VNVLLDTNIVLDVLLECEPWFADSQDIWQACDEQRITGYLLASTFTDIYYIARRAVGRQKAREAIELCSTTVAICPIDRVTLEQALLLAGSDFEDNVQIAAAEQHGLDALVTRNPQDFAHAPLPVLAPRTLLDQLL